MMFDARQIARGWLAVALAASTDRDRPQLYRTVHLEQHAAGLRLVATDSYVLLHAFVPDLDHDTTDCPELDEAPIATATAMDPHGRGKGFLSYALKLATEPVDGLDPEPIEVRVRFNVRAEEGAQGTLAGLEARTVVLEVPGVERVVLGAYDGGYPNVRPFLAPAAAVPTGRILLNPDLVGRLAKIGKIHPSARLGWRFAGENKPAGIEVVDSDPSVDGVVMPARWDFDRNRPAELDADDDRQADGLEGQEQLR